MITHELRHTAGGAPAVLIDSISFLGADDRGAIVVSASHGGESSGEYARGHAPGLVFFNDAGVGKDRAGIRALALLEEVGIAACAVSSDSARIGDVVDHWECGVVSHVNAAATGVIQGMTVQEAIDAWDARR